MALKATIFKAETADRRHGPSLLRHHTLTIARIRRRPTKRMMVAVGWRRNARRWALSFGRGLSTDDEPDLWQKDLTGTIEYGSMSVCPMRTRSQGPAVAPAGVRLQLRRTRRRALVDQVNAKLGRWENLSVISLPAASYPGVGGAGVRTCSCITIQEARSGYPQG